MRARVTARRHSASPPPNLSLLVVILVFLALSILTSHNRASVTEASSTLPVAVAQTSSVWDGLRYAYVFGGITAADTSSASILRFDARADTTLVMAAQLPSGRDSTSAIWDSRSLPNLGCPDGCAYIFGGTGDDHQFRVFDEIVQFDPYSPVTQVSPTRLPQPRYGSAAVWNGQYAYILGGATFDAEETGREILRFDPATRTVAVMGAQLPFTMQFSSAVWDARDRPSEGCPNGCVYVFGGSTSAAGTTDAIFRFNPTTDIGRTMQAKLPSARMWTAAAWDGAHAYIFGGTDARGRLGDILRYDPANDKISLLPDALDPERNAASAIWASPIGYIFGGNLASASRTADIFRFHPPPANSPPVASFLATTAGLTAAVDASASSDPDQDALSFAWEWGDGTTGSGGPTNSHTYTSPGPYSIHVTISDAQGSQATTTRSVSIRPTPPRLPAPNQPPIASFKTATDRLTVHVDASASADPEGPITSYAWSWDDGSPDGTGVMASHAYAVAGSFTVGLTVRDAAGLTSSTAKSVTVPAAPNQFPVPSFNVEATDLRVVVNASASADADGTIAAYTWTWGDSSPATNGASTTHDYAAPGIYSITLETMDDRGASATTSRSVTLTAPPSPMSSPSPNEPPTASFNVTLSGANASVDASPSTDADGRIAAFRWSWGDGTPVGAGVTAAHTYTTPGNYTIRLTVTDSAGATGNATRRITIEPERGPTLSEPDPTPATPSGDDSARSPDDDPPQEPPATTPATPDPDPTRVDENDVTTQAGAADLPEEPVHHPILESTRLIDDTHMTATPSPRTSNPEVVVPNLGVLGSLTAALVLALARRKRCQ